MLICGGGHKYLLVLYQGCNVSREWRYDMTVTGIMCPVTNQGLCLLDGVGINGASRDLAEGDDGHTGL